MSYAYSAIYFVKQFVASAPFCNIMHCIMLHFWW